MLFVLPFMVACVTDGKTGGNTVTDSDTIVVDTINNASKVVVGTVGEGTTMHMLELVTDDDSLYYFDYENNVIGGLVAGDVVNVLYEETDGVTSAFVITNLSALSHLWALADTDGKQHLELNDGGNATVFGMDIDYDHWDVYAGKLVLKHMTEADTLNITLLTEDSLIVEGKSETIKMFREN